MAKSDAEQAASAKPRALPSHIILQADRGEHHAGKVLAADADLIAAIEVEGVAYRPATDFERRLGGFPD